MMRAGGEAGALAAKLNFDVLILIVAEQRPGQLVDCSSSTRYVAP